MEDKDKSAQDNEGMEKLTPLQLNGMKLDDKHTVLTPKKLEGMAEGK